jgi:hypothetical protein
MSTRKEGVTPQNGETISLRPSWRTAVRIYIAVLQNADASPEAHAGAEADLLRLADTVDNLNRENDHE